MLRDFITFYSLESAWFQLLKLFYDNLLQIFAFKLKLRRYMAARRPGDAAEVYAKTDKALAVLGWAAQHSIEDCCRDQWNWASANPYGYGSAE